MQYTLYISAYIQYTINMEQYTIPACTEYIQKIDQSKNRNLIKRQTTIEYDFCRSMTRFPGNVNLVEEIISQNVEGLVTIDQTRNSGASNAAQFTYEMNIPTTLNNYCKLNSTKIKSNRNYCVKSLTQLNSVI